MNYSEEQLAAINLCTDLSAPIAGVTGEAGTGKTTLLQKVKEDLTARDLSIGLAAPTGRAAKRITEATGSKALTIHRMMRYSMPEDDEDQGIPAHGPDNPLPYDVVLIDEASMVNDDLYRSVIDALRDSAVIRFFGDANQLPPVTGKSPFKKLLRKFPSVTLTENYRSGDGIVSAAREVLRGRIPAVNAQYHTHTFSEEGIYNTLNKFKLDDLRTFQSQLITPQNRGRYGTVALNSYLQHRLNPATQAFQLSWKDKTTAETVTLSIKRGDKIIWTKNDYRLGLFNGMLGFIEDYDDEGNIQIEFEDVTKVIPPLLESFDPHNQRSIFQYDPRRSISLAYAITTHKAQGSEFDNVILILTACPVMERANFYTAVTRAKHKIDVLVGRGAYAAAMKKKQL